MKVLFLFFLILLFSSCDFKRQQDDYKPSEKQLLVNEIRQRAAKKIYIKTGLKPSGTIGQMLYEIKKVGLVFDYNKPITLEEGRKLLLMATNELVSEVNAEKRVHQYLYNYPFKPKNIEIQIILRNPDGTNPEPGKLSVIVNVNNILEYDIRDQETKRLKTIHKETYEEALMKAYIPGMK